jgi:hypothetical protein
VAAGALAAASESGRAEARARHALPYLDGLNVAARYAICIVTGLLVGGGAAVHAVRAGFSDGTLSSGPWETGKDFGSADASALVRARVALAGLLALPRGEAMYFTARTDSSGEPLDGRCRYAIHGGRFDARWWSITLYDRTGYLIPNPWHRYSVGSSAVPSGSADDWTIAIDPAEQPGLWIPSTDAPAFDLTLRLYHPGAAIREAPQSAAMPEIRRMACTK